MSPSSSPRSLLDPGNGLLAKDGSLPHPSCTPLQAPHSTPPPAHFSCNSSIIKGKSESKVPYVFHESQLSLFTYEENTFTCHHFG